MVSSEQTARRYGPLLAKQGVWVIDDSSEFRLHPEVPLIIPEINASALKPHKKLIASPNCTMTGLAVAGHPLHKTIGVKAARISSYQAVSGAGKLALAEFFSQLRDIAPGLKNHEGAPLIENRSCAALPKPIAFNVFPQVGAFDQEGRSSEENKVAAELRKVWNAPGLGVSVTAVRVPVVRGHCLSVWLELKTPLKPRQAFQLLRKAPGLRLLKQGEYPTALSAAGRWPVYAGRLRQGLNEKELCLWIASDNLLKGAALNSIQIAEALLKRRWLP
jgi:aspartate-semialdehyde dehydrogenase